MNDPTHKTFIQRGTGYKVTIPIEELEHARVEIIIGNALVTYFEHGGWISKDIRPPAVAVLTALREAGYTIEKFGEGTKS